MTPQEGNIAATRTKKTAVSGFFTPVKLNIGLKVRNDKGEPSFAAKLRPY